jgi:hypothetical protein
MNYRLCCIFSAFELSTKVALVDTTAIPITNVIPLHGYASIFVVWRGCIETTWEATDAMLNWALAITAGRMALLFGNWHIIESHTATKHPPREHLAEL